MVNAALKQDYCPFGELMPGRTFSSSSYRFGFNGKEDDNEIKGIGNSIAFEARIYDPRLGFFLSIDPLFKKYSWQSPYSIAHNNPIALIDYKGLGDEPDGDGFRILLNAGVIYQSNVFLNGIVTFDKKYQNKTAFTYSTEHTEPQFQAMDYFSRLSFAMVGVPNYATTILKVATTINVSYDANTNTVTIVTVTKRTVLTVYNGDSKGKDESPSLDKAKETTTTNTTKYHATYAPGGVINFVTSDHTKPQTTQTTAEVNTPEDMIERGKFQQEENQAKFAGSLNDFMRDAMARDAEEKVNEQINTVPH